MRYEFHYSKRRLNNPWLVYAEHGIEPPKVGERRRDVWEFAGTYSYGNVQRNFLLVITDDGDVLKYDFSHDDPQVRRDFFDHLKTVEGVVIRSPPLEQIAGEAKTLPAGQRLLPSVISRVKGLLPGYKK